MDTTLIVGVDIGGTKTRLMACRDGQILADDLVPTESWRVRDLEPDAEALGGLVRGLCQGQDPAALAVGAHGCDTDPQCRAYRAALSRVVSGAITVVNDSELMVPAAGLSDGVGVVAGTGSIAVARTADGRMLTAGGWGWILGDEGSAPALVREAARAVRGALDRGEASADPLVAALMGEVGTDDPTRLGRLLDATRGAATWGRYAQAVFTAAAEGSPLARVVVREGGQALAALVGILIGRGANADRVVAGGGVIAEQPALMEAFTDAMAQVSPRSRVLLLREPPVIGAIALARRLLG